MNRLFTASCSDINSPFCPCLLADTNHCTFCSHLSGCEMCDCNWSGVCILYEKRWQDKACNDRGGSRKVRTEYDSVILRQELVATDTYLLEFAVPEELAFELAKTGAFVFLRSVDDPQYCHFPVGVMKVDNNKVQVVVESTGPKSKRLLEAASKHILVRGPYYNGILGQPWIDNIDCGTIILVAGGMGQPPALPIAAKLKANKNDVMAIVAPGKVEKVFIDQELRQLGVAVTVVDSMRRNGLRILRQWFDLDRKCDLVVSAGPDEQHYGVIGAMQAAGVNLPLAVTNNAKMCCGEGICGSCECETLNNQKLKICKVQTDFTKLACPT